jgi:pimeloyl-ACP methyl ester carboxylesterase
MIAASGDAAWVTDEAVTGYTQGAFRDLPATLDAFRAIARAKEPSPITDQLGKVRVPVRLLLGGAKHSAGPPDDEIRVLSDGLPSMTIDTVPGAGHHLAEERPERVVEALVVEPAVAAAVPR